MYIVEFLQQLIYRVKVRKLASVHRTAMIKKVTFEGHNSVMRGSVVQNSFLGEGTYISINSKIYNTRIGRYSSIADNVSIVIGKHPVSEFVSTFPSFYYNTTSQIGFSFHKGSPIFQTSQHPTNESYYNVVIGNDVWVGSHAIIMGGITIGDGAVIAAGAVVTKDVEPYSIVGGVPAKHIKYRFSEDVIKQLLIIKWWNKPFCEIQDNYQGFLNIMEFLSNENGNRIN